MAEPATLYRARVQIGAVVHIAVNSAGEVTDVDINNTWVETINHVKALDEDQMLYKQVKSASNDHLRAVSAIHSRYWFVYQEPKE